MIDALSNDAVRFAFVVGVMTGLGAATLAYQSITGQFRPREDESNVVAASELTKLKQRRRDE